MMKMDSDGHVSFLDNNGNEIIDTSIIRKIKSQSTYQQQFKELNIQRLQQIDKMVRESEETEQSFVNIGTYSAMVKTRDDFEKELSELQPDVYAIPSFGVPVPTMDSVIAILEEEANEQIQGFILTVGKKRREYVENNLDYRFSLALEDWEINKEVFKNQQTILKEKMDAEFQEEYKAKKKHLEAILRGEYPEICDDFDAWIHDIELPVEIDIDFEYDMANNKMLLDVDLPEIEDLPTTTIIKTDTGKAKEKKKTQKELRDQYAKTVFGLAMYLTTNTFNISPEIREVVISGYTQRRNKDGDIFDCYIYSMIIQRENLEHRNINMADPVEYCLHANCRCNMTSTMLFKEIKPFE